MNSQQVRTTAAFSHPIAADISSLFTLPWLNALATWLDDRCCEMFEWHLGFRTRQSLIPVPVRQSYPGR